MAQQPAKSVQPQPPETGLKDTSGFFEAVNRSALAANQQSAGAGVVGLLGFFGILAVSLVFFITENFFIALFGASLGLLVYATGAEIGKLLLSAVTIFFS